MVKTKAWKFILNNNFSSFDVDIEFIINLVESKGWSISSYKNSKQALENLSKLSGLDFKNLTKEAKGFTYVFNEKSPDGANVNKYLIFYDDCMEYKQIIFTIIHEIGHIIMSHTISNNILGRSEDEGKRTVIENEANLFACEVLAPSYILNILKINTIDEIVQRTFIPLKEAELYMQKLCTEKYSNHEHLKQLMYSQYEKFIQQEQFKIQEKELLELQEKKLAEMEKNI